MKNKNLASLFQNKTPPILAGEKKAWVMHGPALAGQEVVAGDVMRRLSVHAARATVNVREHDDVSVPDALRRIIAGGYSAMLAVDTTDPLNGITAHDMVGRLKANDYHVTLVSCWAPLNVCADRNPAVEPHLVASRADALADFPALVDMADATRVYYLTAANLVPGEVLAASRVNMKDLQFRTTSEHRNLLGRMVADLSGERANHPAWARDFMRNAGIDAGAMVANATGMSEKLRRMAGSLLLPASPRPGGPRGL